MPSPKSRLGCDDGEISVERVASQTDGGGLTPPDLPTRIAGVSESLVEPKALDVVRRGETRRSRGGSLGPTEVQHAGESRAGESLVVGSLAGRGSLDGGSFAGAGSFAGGSFAAKESLSGESGVGRESHVGEHPGRGHSGDGMGWWHSGDGMGWWHRGPPWLRRREEHRRRQRLAALRPGWGRQLRRYRSGPW